MARFARNIRVPGQGGTLLYTRRVREFTDKVAVVTGAASGIGKAMAQRFAIEGMRLVLADVESVPLAEFANQLRAAGMTVVSEQVDVSKPEDLERLAARAYGEFGAVHLLCNNAGVLPPGAPVWKEPLQTWRWALDVNFFGVLHGVQAFVPQMLKAKHEAHIVNTASLAGLTTRPLMSAYNVSKHAVVALSECLYAELRLTTDKVHVSVLCPAFSKTRLAESARNRPEGVTADAGASFGFHDAIRRVVEEGTPPEKIVDITMKAVRENHFWILTHPQFDGSVRERFESMLSRANPTVRDLRTESIPLD
ncbi:MAG TPA: SDR family NAD(P)-dependent oxidoreductase [Bryobacteraceae bacterium]|nr:SDR family NAD(P)-dependent oxidoreductase [Bryobacteraceae bacterium]